MGEDDGVMQEPDPCSSTRHELEPAPNLEQIQQRVGRRPRFSIDDASKSVKQHLESLLLRRLIVCVLSLAVSCVSVLFNIINTSLVTMGVIPVGSAESQFLKFAGIILTIFLLGSIIAYHVFDAQLHLLLHTSTGTHRPQVPWKRLLQLIVELLVCCVTPPTFIKMPRSWELTLDQVLGPLVLMRLYVIPRTIQVILFGRRIPPYLGRSQSALKYSHYAFSTKFWIRKVVNRFPLSCLIGTVVLVTLTSAWAFYMQERNVGHIRRYLEALWFAVVTLTHVGYGDVVPVTPAGKVTACIISVSGWICAGFLIFFISTKFRLSSDEFEALKVLDKSYCPKSEMRFQSELHELHTKCNTILESIDKVHELIQTQTSCT